MASEVTHSHIVLRHHEIKIDDNSPSIIQFCIHPNSIHHQIWCNEFKFESTTQIVGPSVQLDEEQFLVDDIATYTAISNMLAASLEIDSLAQASLVLKIIANASRILHENLTVTNVNWVISLELYVVTAYGLVDEAMEQSCDTLDEEEEEIEMPTMPTTTLFVTY